VQSPWGRLHWENRLAAILPGFAIVQSPWGRLHWENRLAAILLGPKQCLELVLEAFVADVAHVEG
jgi:hypothetical protein